MFGFKKQEVEEFNEYDEEMRSLRNTLCALGHDIETKAVKIYLKSQTLCVYLNGTENYNQAFSEVEELKKRLDKAMKYFDEEFAKTEDYWANNHEKFTYDWDAPRTTSHDWVEIGLKHQVFERIAR